MSYSQYFDFSGGPELKTGKVYLPSTQFSLGGAATAQYVSDGTQDTKASKAFDKIMAGHDETTSQYVNTLKSIYDGYEKYADDYEGQVQPIIDALGGDIEGMEGYIDNYNELLAQNKDTFLNGIILDPDSSRTRSEYTSEVSNQYDAARDSLKRNMLSQGQNPYENKGASRDLALNRAKDIGGAAGQAYTDWRSGNNRDKQAQQNAVGQYMGLQGQAANMQNNVIQARSGIGDFYGNTLNSKLQAGQAKAQGYEGLTSLAESRRQESLGLGQQQQENSRYTADIKQQLDAKIPQRDKSRAALYGLR